MGKKISFKKYAKVCMDYVNRDNQNSIWGFKKENLPDPSKVFNLHAAEKIAAEKKKSLPKIETCRTIKLKITPKRRCWKNGSGNQKQKSPNFSFERL